MASLEHDVPITPSTVFYIASLSKQFTAAAVVLAAQQGSLTLDDDVRRWVPEVPDFGTRITIRHLLHHTSGLREQLDLLELAGWRLYQDPITEGDLMAQVSRQRELNFRPGTEYAYNNLGYTLLAVALKRATGQSLREFAAVHIFQPLGMSSTVFLDDHTEVVKNLAFGYRSLSDGRFRGSNPNSDGVGPNGLITTVRDLLRWDQNFGSSAESVGADKRRMPSAARIYRIGPNPEAPKIPELENRGPIARRKLLFRSGLEAYPSSRHPQISLRRQNFYQPRVGGRAMIDQLHERPVLADVDQARAASFGLRLYTYRGLRVEGFGGGEAAFRSAFWRFPDRRFSVVVLCNAGSANQGQLLQRVADVYLKTEFPAPVSGSSSASPPTGAETAPSRADVRSLSDYAGTYLCDEIDAIYRFTVEDNTLVLRHLKSSPALLTQQRLGVFTDGSGTDIAFVRGRDGAVTGFVLHLSPRSPSAGPQRISFTRVSQP